MVTLECMRGVPSMNLRDVADIRRNRELNKLFGIDHGERWSGCKLLIDFLESMFNDATPASAKFEKPVGLYTTSKMFLANLVKHEFIVYKPEYGLLVPLLELVPLECFALWCPAAAKF
jgi:hypothetical protein